MRRQQYELEYLTRVTISWVNQESRGHLTSRSSFDNTGAKGVSSDYHYCFDGSIASCEWNDKLLEMISYKSYSAVIQRGKHKHRGGLTSQQANIVEEND